MYRKFCVSELPEFCYRIVASVGLRKCFAVTVCVFASDSILFGRVPSITEPSGQSFGFIEDGIPVVV